ncbi:hypothetical protein BDZ89DRAFT_1069782 [Hymenopellis radicata]|nr:hypothetical protein BDZ89DRAFT_1069782 [Hymenopellis radicata]
MINFAAATLAGSWLNTGLYVSQIIFSVWYLNNVSMMRMYRLGICFCMVADGACSIVVMANAYMRLTMPEVSLGEEFWTLPILILLTYLSSTVEQSFFVYRYWTISRNKWITAFVGVLIVGHYACAIVTATYVFLYPIVTQGSLGLKFTIAVATICTGTDIIIALALAWTLSTIETPFAATKSLLRRVAFYAVSCGLTTAATTILMVVLLFTDLSAFSVVFSVLGRVYSLTIIVNLMMVRSNQQTYQGSLSRSRRSEGPTAPPAIATPIFFNSTLDPSDAVGKSFQGNSTAETHHVQYPPQAAASPHATTNSSFTSAGLQY